MSKAVAHNEAERKHTRAKARPGRRERAKQEKREKIVDAARHLFTTKGFDRTTTSEIAERADIGSGTLFTYAPTKDDLLVMVFHDEIMAVNRRAFEDVPSQLPALDQIVHVFAQMISYHEQDMDLHRRITKILMDAPDAGRLRDINEMNALVHEGFSNIVRSRQQAGELSPKVDPDTAGKTFFAIYYLNMLLWMAAVYSKDELLNHLRQQIGLAITGMAAGL